MASSTKNFLLDLLAAASQQGLPVAALVRGCAVMGLRSNAVRVSLSRLKAEGWVHCDTRGWYRLSAQMPGLSAELSKWREIDRHTRAWKGGWVAVHLDALNKGDKARRLRRSRALRMLGFRTWRPGLALRPDNLRGGLARCAERLYLAGLDASQPVFRLGEPPCELADLWEVPDLERGYAQGIEDLQRAQTRLSSLDVEPAAAQAFELGNDALKRFSFDPLLPAEMVDTRLRARYAAAVLRHDKLARGFWSQVLGVDFNQLSAARPRDAQGLQQFSAHL